MDLPIGFPISLRHILASKSNGIGSVVDENDHIRSGHSHFPSESPPRPEIVPLEGTKYTSNEKSTVLTNAECLDVMWSFSSTTEPIPLLLDATIIMSYTYGKPDRHVDGADPGRHPADPS